jgi:iron complex outermembrane recepter protein
LSHKPSARRSVGSPRSKPLRQAAAFGKRLPVGRRHTPLTGDQDSSMTMEQRHSISDFLGPDAPSAATRVSSPKCGSRALVRFSTGFAALAVALVLAIPSRAQQKQVDLTNESLQDLMNVEVTSVSRREQKLSQTAAAVFVITQEDIGRSGATNIPDLLRMVPGLDVAQINANTWAISARGLNGRFANELLVLLDGRSVYTQTTGGVFWDVLDIPLDDIERIEVIRGPGASIWGANAVNGVINIITKKASETPGALVVAGGGTVDQGFGTLQYGGNIGRTSFRAFTKYKNEDRFPDSNGPDGGDGWNISRVGFRTDTDFSPADTLTFEGDLYRGREGEPADGVESVVAPLIPDVRREVNLGGGFAQAVWNHTTSPRSGTSLQASYDGYERNDNLGETRGTSDITFQDRFGWGARQDLIWGAEYRYSQSRTSGSLFVSLDPPNLNTQLFSSFVQDEITLLPNRLFLTAGVKLEHSHYTGFAGMPSVRLAWTPSARQALWLAASDADRTPSDTDESLRASLGGFTGPSGPVALQLTGNPNLKNERTDTYEAGYRISFVEQLSVDVTAYYNGYRNQETTEPGTPFFVSTPAPPHTVLPLVYANLMHGESHGAEIAANWKVAKRWTLNPGYAFQQIHMHLDPTSQDTTSVSGAQGSSPVHSAQLRSHLTLASGLFWDASAYFVGRLSDPVIPSYTRLDSGFTWQWNKKLSISFVGQNLLKDRHEEFVDSTGSAATTLIKRSTYVQWRWQF